MSMKILVTASGRSASASRGFVEIDANGDGKISFEEATGLNIQEESLDKFSEKFTKADKNGNSFIDPDEYQSFLLGKETISIPMHIF